MRRFASALGAMRVGGFAAGVCVALALLVPAGCVAAEEAAKPARDDTAAQQLGWRLSLQCWTLNKLTLFEAIDRAKELGIRHIEMFPGQKMSPEKPVPAGHMMSPEDRAALKAKLAEAGITVVNYGVVGLGKDEAGARPVFEFAREMGIETLCTEPAQDALETLDRLACEYGVNLALHNHPKDSRYWDPQVVVDACKGRSRHVGACADTGHWMRSGINPVEGLRKLEGRIVTFHLKDITGIGVRGAHDVPWGTGAGDFAGMMAEIRRQGFTGAFSIEYEHWDDHLMANLAKCVAAFDAAAAEQLKATPAETGAEALFNGKDLAGWTFSGDAVKGAWSVKDGVLANKGKPGGYIRTEKEYQNFVLRLEFRHVTKGNGGVLLRMTGPDKIWPRSLECQGQFGSVGDIWNIDNVPMKADPARTQGRRTAKLRPSSERPLGEWNAYDITMDGGELIVKVNGVLQNTATGCEEIPGKICLQSEGAEMEFRNIRVIPIER